VRPVLLDGPTGTELARRGVAIDGPGWSARAIRAAPATLRQIHADYAGAGATVHTAATFRTRPGDVGPAWRARAAEAVAIARAAVPSWHRVAGSVGPIGDCYDPSATPPDAAARHAELAFHLADLGVDLLLCETFPNPDEAAAAVAACAATGLPVWCALTPGFRGDLLTPRALADGARACATAGAAIVLVSCAPAARALPWVDALAGTGLPFGAYANAGDPADGVGWRDDAEGPTRYLAAARAWADRGATVIGGCCGTTPAHVRALRLGVRPSVAGGRPSDGKL
jgi:S-methylmethionine-dependent homocysteine/selenocysteine methylase